MLIKPKEIDQKEITGFTKDIDIFQRKPLGDTLANLLESTDENIIIGIDSQWGEGKSMFAKMFSAHLKNTRETLSIYFDAFENDYQKDPFLAIASEVVDLINTHSPELKTEFKSSAIRASKAIARGALRIGIKTLTAGVLDGSIIDELGTADDIGSEISQGLDQILIERLDEAKADKNSLENFRSTLESHISKIGNGRPVVFIIDELDRCRPDFSLELIEQIKHLFTVKNLKFILITNKKQTQAIIKKRYGAEIDAHLYLQKFIDLWISLPRIETEYQSNTSTYLKYLINKIATPEEKISNDTTIETLKEIFIANKTSFRGIQKTLSYFAILHNSSPTTKYYEYYQVMMAIGCYSKAEKPELMHAIYLKESEEKIKSLLFPTPPIGSREYRRLFTTLIVKYLISPPDIQNEMIRNQEIQTDFGRAIADDCMEKINNTLSLISQ
ncbi:KAP family NTPase [Pseudomonas chengduensis]|nr:P-loop NTPase fold protein [Pseudomonas chengduensis]MDH1730234.1 KAP family NTPase [Pseudomonas chengduensis]